MINVDYRTIEKYIFHKFHELNELTIRQFHVAHPLEALYNQFYLYKLVRRRQPRSDSNAWYHKFAFTHNLLLIYLGGRMI